MEMNNFLATIINGLYDLVNLVISGISAILPNFSVSDWLGTAFAPFGQFLGAINYFVPFGLMIDIAAAWLSAVLVWYVVQFILRFIQLGN